MAEQRFGLPPGLLLAIGRVESGRWDPRLGRVIPWPWSIDVDGTAHLFDNAEDAERTTGALQAQGGHSIDVGCFQISLLHHPNAFADLNDAFDPWANARYAARFLTSLRARLGNWQDAVAAYHSATPALGLTYRQRVFAAWPGVAEFAPAGAITEIFGMRVWGPSSSASARQGAAVQQELGLALPRVITPSR